MSADEIHELERAVEADILRLIRDAGQNSLDYLIEKIRKRRALLAIKPEFTPEVVGIAKQIIAFGGAGFGFVITFGHSIPSNLGPLTVGLALLYVNITLVSMLVLVWFFLQARTRYPWLYLERLGNSEQYFYYSAVPTTYKYKPLFTSRQLAKSLDVYLQNLSRFAGVAVKESKVDELKSELMQYHLLVFYQGYLDQYEQQLTHLALYGFLASALCAVVGASLFGVFG